MSMVAEAGCFALAPHGAATPIIQHSPFRVEILRNGRGNIATIVPSRKMRLIALQIAHLLVQISISMSKIDRELAKIYL